MLFKPADGGPRCTHGGAELEDDEGWEKPAGKSRGRRVAHTDGVARQCTSGQASASHARGYGWLQTPKAPGMPCGGIPGNGFNA